MTPKFKDLKDYSDVELAAWTICGYLGSGLNRKRKLGDRYNSVQRIVNNILHTGEIPVVEKSDPVTTEAIIESVKSVYTDAAEELTAEIVKRIGD